MPPVPPARPALVPGVRRLAAGADEPGVLPALRPWARVLAGLGLVLVFTVDVAQLAGGAQDDAFAVALLALAHVGAVGAAARYPLTGWRVSAIATLLTPLFVPGAGRPWPAVVVVLHLAVLFLLALAVPPRVTAVAAGLAALVGTAWTLAAGTPALNGTVGTVGVVLLVAALGVAIRTQRGTATRLAEARRGAAAEQARRAVLEERTRIAREMHDVVAHHLSALAVRAESAPHRVPDTTPGAAAEFGTIAGAARDALTDMRRLLGVLRADDPDRPSAPAPDLDGIAELVTTLRGSGVDVVTDFVGEPRDVPAEVGVAGFRVVQEALSNAARHATGAAVRVRVEWRPGAVRLRVDSGVPTVAVDRDGDGIGLIGMRERVAAVGGELHAGPRPGGYTVDATLPAAP